MPNLLVAPKPTKTAATTDPGEIADPYVPYGESGRGWYADGAYTAAPVDPAAREQEKDGDLDPQEAYYHALLARFDNLRTTLAASPPPPPPPPPRADSDGLTLITRALLSNATFRTWRNTLLKSAPTPRILCSLPQESIIQGVEVLEAVLTLPNLRGEREKRIGAWTWGLLGRCRDVGEMDSEDVSILRGFGKKASALLRRMRAVGDGGGVGEEETNDEEAEAEGMEPEADVQASDAQNVTDVRLSDEVAITETGVTLDAETPLAEAQRALLSRLGPVSETTAEDTDPAPKAKEDIGDDRALRGGSVEGEGEQATDAHATLDMIVTIVGECYGQRDLLDGRLAWEEL